MEKPLLNDKSVFPDDGILSIHLGKTKSIWDEFTGKLPSDFQSMTLDWKYYMDGKSWLCKLALKKKTICWISIWKNFFKLTFYFTDKNDSDIKNLKIEQPLKKRYFEKKGPGKLNPLVVEVKSKKTLKDVFELINYKISKNQTR